MDKKKIVFFHFIIGCLLEAILLPSPVNGQILPSETYGELFVKVQMAHLFKDSKTFADAVALRPPDDIVNDYEASKNQPNFNLRKFVSRNFSLPSSKNSHFESDTTATVAHHINRLWPVLTRWADTATDYSSLIPLPHPYVVPGGRFREVYYWDSYFTLLGLAQSGKIPLMRDMVNNFAYLIKRYGFIPNGNRSYYLSRSQPPFFSMMVRLLANASHQRKILVHYLPAMEKEYQFWMKGADSVDEKYSAFHNVVRLGDGAILNRYWDNSARPRPEAFREDSLLARKSTQKPADLYRNLRAAAESGWDFSSRWLKDGKSLATIRTTNIIPVDLNSLMYEMEKTLAKAWRIKGHTDEANFYLKRAQKRRKWIRQYCWNKKKNFYSDYNFVKQTSTGVVSLAGMYPLFLKVATDSQAGAAVPVLQKKLVKPGGVITTPNNTGQQWDAPNGWAPLQWITYKGLKNYGFDRTAAAIRKRWMKLNERVFHQTAKMEEKYNVEDLSKRAGGGEYDLQDGFGWTNGVYLQFKNASDNPKLSRYSHTLFSCVMLCAIAACGNK